MNPFATALCSRVLEGATGALDWTDGKRRRIVYLEQGRVVLLQSNLRSETPERIAELTPGLSPEASAAAAIEARCLGALKEPAGEFTFAPGATAPRREPADFVGALWLLGLPELSPSLHPRLVGGALGWLHREPLPPGLAGYLGELDGTRDIEEITSFGPVEPEVVARWIRIGIALGAIVDAGAGASTYEVRNVTKRRDWGGGVDDIAGMIADGLGEPRTAKAGASAGVSAAPASADPAEARFGPMLHRVRGAADHFASLGVSWQDPPETMRRAYFTLARELHPDRFVEASPEIQAIAAELFDKVRGAWEVLGDDTKREAYVAKVIRGEKSEDELAMEKVRAILDAEGDFKRGLAEFHAGRLAQAHELFGRAAELVPEEHEFAAYAGYTTFKMFHGRDNDRAELGVARIGEAIAANDRLDGAHVLMGLVYRAKGDDVRGRESFVRALRIKPSNPDALREMKRLERGKEEAPAATSGLFGKLFGGKK